jgi:hypothetical protein
MLVVKLSGKELEEVLTSKDTYNNKPSLCVRYTHMQGNPNGTSGGERHALSPDIETNLRNSPLYAIRIPNIHCSMDTANYKQARYAEMRDVARGYFYPACCEAMQRLIRSST